MDSKKANIKLYGSLFCPYVQRVRAFLEELKVPFEYQEVDLYSGEHRSEKIRVLNPIGKLPFLVLDGNQVISESNPINEYLAENYGKEFLPEDLIVRANMRRWMNFFDGTIIPSVLSTLRYARRNDAQNLKKSINNAKKSLKFFAKHSGLIQRQKSLKRTDIYFLGGDRVGLLDFTVLPFLQNIESLFNKGFNDSIFRAEATDNDEEGLQALKAYYEFAKKNASFLKANKNVPFIPQENNTLLKELNMLTKEKFDYETYAYQYYLRRFLTPPAKL